MKPRHTRLIALALGVLTTLLVLLNQREVGIARDEVVYFNAGARYADWWVGLVTFDHGIGRENLEKNWGGAPGGGNNTEHPPLIKTLFGLSHKLFKNVLGEVTSYRLPSAILHGVLVALVFLMVMQLWGLAEALVAALLVMLLPRAVFHAGLACFDAPIMTMWFATVYTYWRCLDDKIKIPWQAGVVFGLALATKHNAVLLPFALALHYGVVGFRTAGWRGIVMHRPRLIVSFMVLGPLTLILLWPWLWFDTYAHVKTWLTFHMKHVHYNFEYLGHNWNAPRFPWHVALVTTLFTVPVATLASAVAGAAVWIAKRAELPDKHRSPVLLLVLSAAASIGPFFLGTTPIFGAEKHWMPALPTICIAAAVGIVWAARAAIAFIETRRALSPRVQHGILAAVAGVVVLASATETITAQPYALTWYNALAGGAPGGADKGMNRHYWGYAARGVLPVLAAEPASSTPTPVYSHDASPAWGLYIRDGLIPKTMHDSGHEEGGIANSKYALVIHEKHFNRHDYLVWKIYGSVQPMFVLRADGVPIVSLYKRH
ncbi:MAG: glycosyltransferase family 39 protein [Deltaproteobacteria bacterium]|nr:glycosyltransferase family 39 protein [Deltaproteobacteria bacterium]